MDIKGVQQCFYQSSSPLSLQVRETAVYDLIHVLFHESSHSSHL